MKQTLAIAMHALVCMTNIDMYLCVTFNSVYFGLEFGM